MQPTQLPRLIIPSEPWIPVESPVRISRKRRINDLLSEGHGFTMHDDADELRCPYRPAPHTFRRPVSSRWRQESILISGFARPPYANVVWNWLVDTGILAPHEIQRIFPHRDKSERRRFAIAVQLQTPDIARRIHHSQPSRLFDGVMVLSMSRLRDPDLSMDWIPSRSQSPDSSIKVDAMEVDRPFLPSIHRLDGDASMESDVAP